MPNNQFMARSAVPFAGTLAVNRLVVPATVVNKDVVLNHLPPIIVDPPADPIEIPPPPPLPASLPLAASRIGNLFADNNDSSLRWYLPQLALADDVDPSFAFVASQTDQQLAGGQPLNVARVTLRITKSRPADIVQFSAGNPGTTLQEIPLSGMTAVLSSFYSDQTGQQQQRTFNASSIQDMGNGSFLLTFDSSILGDSVIGLYQDLRLIGKAAINLSASYQAWVRQGIPLPPTNLRIRMMEMPVVNVRAFGPGGIPRFPSGASSLVEQGQSWGATLPLGLKYNLDGYQFRFTVSTAKIASHVILSTKDLMEFTGSQTEFEEFKALGDLTDNYKTLSRAYFGVISRTIVVIPQRYSIVRGTGGCAATCLARVDSSPASGSQCLFEFSFTIAPEISRIEWAKLQQEILSNSDFSGYHLTFPSFLRDTPLSTLQTTFKSSAQFAAGADQHTFAVTVSVQDNGPETPAVTDANLFILRLISQTGTDLVGSLDLKLDDGFPDAVTAIVDLNFLHTVGTDELVVALDESGAVIKVTNQSPLDLQLSKYALILGSNILEFPGVINLAAGGTVSLPLPENHTGLEFVADAQLAVPSPLSLSAVTKFLNFMTVDVQQTQYFLAADGSGVDFTRVASVAVGITFTTLPNMTPRQLQLDKNVRADFTHVQIPLENAMFSLPGTINLTVQFVTPSLNPLVFTMQNEFTSEPVLILLQSDIDKHLLTS